MNEAIRENDETQLSLEKIWDFFKRNLIILLAALLVGLAGGFCVSRFAIPRKYASTVKIFTPNSNGSLSLTELNLNKSLIGDYEQIIQSHAILDDAYAQAKATALNAGHPLTDEFEVVDANGNSTYNYRKLLKSLSFGNPGDNCILSITVTAKDPYVAAYLVNAIANVAAEKVPIIMNTRSMSVYEPGRAVTTPVSPNNARNTILGGLLMLVLAIGVLVLRALFDTSMKNAEDVKARLGLATLGLISDHNAEEEGSKKHKKSYGYGYGYHHRKTDGKEG